MQIWKTENPKDDKIIAYFNQTIYKGNPKPGEVDQDILTLKTSNIPQGNYFGIPLRYISTINLQDGKDYIEVLFRGDSEHLKISDLQKREEIFEYFKQIIPGNVFFINEYSKLKAGKKPLIALGVLIPVFLWALYIAIEKEQGVDYDVTGQNYNSLAGIILVLASLGVKNLVLLFGALFSIAIFSFIRKTKKPPVIKQLIIKH